MTNWVCFLRAVNVGGKNKIKMAELRAALESHGFQSVKTYIQSGNVIFRSPETDSEVLKVRIEAILADEFDIQVPVILRTKDEVEKCLEELPFQEPDLEEKWLLITFLDTEPSVTEPSLRLKKERLVLRGRHLYLYYPEGVGKSKLTNVKLEKAFQVVGTARNLRTLRKILTL